MRQHIQTDSITHQLLRAFRRNVFTMSQAYAACSSRPRESIRARIYESLGRKFERIEKGVYSATLAGLQTILVEGDGRNLSFLKDKSIDAIITDHPWRDEHGHKGGNRNFASSYESIEYQQQDFYEKARVLKDGCFLVEFLPLENETNWKALARIKEFAANAGFHYYAKVPYYENRVRNTGRTSKAGGDVLIFSKGKARSLRPDVKKNKAAGVTDGHYMSGAAGMLPVYLNAPLPSKKDMRHQSQKSLALIKALLSYITRQGELVLDQFAGSFATCMACAEIKRLSIGIEANRAFIEQAAAWFHAENYRTVVTTNSTIS